MEMQKEVESIERSIAKHQETERCGDGDIVALAKEVEEPADKDSDWRKDRVDRDKDEAGDVRGGPKVRHAANNHAKKPRKATSVDGYSGDQDPDPNRVQNYSDQTVEARLAKLCDSLAEFYADENGVSKNVAYDALLKSNKTFQMIWKHATGA